MTTYSNDYSIYSISFGLASRSTDINSEFWWNTWEDWHMVPTSRPLINAPKTRTQYVQVPGRDGPLDYSEAIDGIHFDIYTGSWEFMVLHEFNNNIGLTWPFVYSEIMNALHGRELQVVLTERPTVAYTGRIFVENPRSEDHYTLVTLKYELDPTEHSLDEWLLMNDAVCRQRFSGWVEFNAPFVSPYSKQQIDRIGAYIRFEHPHPVIEKMAVFLNPKSLPIMRVRGCVKGTNVANATVIPYIARGSTIIATGETNPDLKIGKLNTIRSSSTGTKKWYLPPHYIPIEFPKTPQWTDARRKRSSTELRNFRSWLKLLEFMDDNTVK